MRRTAEHRERRASDGEGALVAALLAIHRKKRERAGQRTGATYAGVLEHFERRGQRLRGERLVTAELLERLVAASGEVPPSPVQQELTLVGPSGGTAAGRCRVTNRSPAPCRFELVTGRPLEDIRVGATAVFHPRTGELAPGASSVIRVEVRLVGWAPGTRRTIPVECRWGAGADRLWLVVEALAPPEEKR